MGEKCEYFLDWPVRKSVADFSRTKTGNLDQKTVADFDNSVADFGLLSSSKISLPMRFSLKNHY